MVKVFILGLDGLEYDLVYKWNLPNLLQKQNGKIKVPISDKTGVPTSPEVWATFLTGKRVRADFVSRGLKGKIFGLFPLKPIIKHLRKEVNLSSIFPKKFSTPKRFPQLKARSFLDITNSKEINAPYYSYNNLAFDFHFRFRHEKLTVQQVVSELKTLYVNIKKQILRTIETLENIDLVFAYMHFPDAVQHHLFPKPRFIKQHYNDIDHFVSLLKECLPDSTLLILISDHGFDFGTQRHSKYGFYSSTQFIDPKPKHITDFFDIILRECS
jgi:predicted AlkP superfamily phosphohydrolase/phosphomutase